MKSKWSEMSKNDKVMLVISIILGVALAFFAVADIANWLEFANACWLILAAAMLALDCIGNWK